MVSVEDRDWAEVFASFKTEENQKKIKLTSLSLRNRTEPTIKEAEKVGAKIFNDDDLVDEMYRLLVETESESWREIQIVSKSGSKPAIITRKYSTTQSKDDGTKIATDDALQEILSLNMEE